MVEGPKSAQQSHEDGVELGRVLGRLDGHDAHLARINGSVEKGALASQHVEKAIVDLRMLVQQQGQQAQADRDKAIALAVALKEQSEKGWSPVAKIFSIIIALSALAAVVTFVLQHRV